MKKLFFILFAMLSLLWSLGAMAQTLVFHLADGTTADVELSSAFRMYTVGGKTTVTLADGSTKEFTQSDILTVTYRETHGDVNRDGAVDVADISSIISIMAGENTDTPDTPISSNSVLSSRLKDKDGNPVLLEGVKGMFSEDLDWIIKYEYDENGALTNYMYRRSNGQYDVYTVNGLTITSTQVGRSETRTIEMQFTLNEHGLVSKISRVDHITWSMTSVLYMDYDYSYNSEDQLTWGQYDSTELIDDGTRKERHREYPITWNSGNPDADGEGAYGDGINQCKQSPLGRHYIDCLDEPLDALCMIGLFGVGPANFPVGHTYTLNPNGTIATEDDNTYLYK